MKKTLNKYAIINIGFYGGLVVKSIDALIEFIGGLLLLILSHNLINLMIQFIALPELIEDPNDVVMNYFITLGQNFSINSQHSLGIYMLLHGTTKLSVIWLLLKRKLWAYPPAAVVFGLFIAYEIYSYMHSPSILLMLFIIIDAAMIVMIILEYKRLKTERAK